MIEFTNNGQTYCYAFPILGIQRISRAQQVFLWHQEQMDQASSKSLRDLKMSGGMDYLADAFNYLLVRKVGDDFQDFNPTDDAPKLFFQSLGSEWWGKIQEVQDDFFGRVGLQQTGSINAAAKLFRIMPPELFEQVIQMQAVASPASSTVNNGSHGSSGQTSSGDD